MNKQKIFFLKIFAFIILSFLIITTKKGFSACVCACVDGEKVPLCESALDIPPPCIGVCSIPPANIPPIKVPNIPPIGTKMCSEKQVYNPYSNRYEWQTVCR